MVPGQQASNPVAVPLSAKGRTWGCCGNLVSSTSVRDDSVDKVRETPSHFKEPTVSFLSALSTLIILVDASSPPFSVIRRLFPPFKLIIRWLKQITSDVTPQSYAYSAKFLDTDSIDPLLATLTNAISYALLLYALTSCIHILLRTSPHCIS